ncbi:MAG TPA: MmcQ/YjbR family DNA-binding protein [Planctomycetota bacterium]|nr:MmcQ/YjbR family DNA-binding protein [Planctomycetota bacterium]
MTPERYLENLRKLCRSLPATTEKPSWGHPNFAAGGKTFAVYEVYKQRPSIAVLATREQQQFLVQDERFYVTPYVGKHGWVSAWLDRAPEWPMLADLVRTAHALATATAAAAAPRQQRPRARSKHKGTRA